MIKHIIWSNRNLNIDDWRDGYKEFLEINEISDNPNDEDAIYDYMIETNNSYLDDERYNLNKKIDGRILVIADIGLWNGRRQGYKILDNIISDILYDRDGEYLEWYGDGYNIKATVSHHDGTNYYEYRVIREDKNIDNFLDAIYNGEKISRKKLNYYTKSLYPYVANVYGWQ